MDATIDKTCTEDKKQKQGDAENDHVPVLTRALSRATKVAGNQSFDHNLSTGNHPLGEVLRKDLERRWNDLVASSALQLTGDKSTSWFRRIYELHTEQGRYYHTVVHLWELFELLDILIESLETSSKWYVAMAWSVFFHDAIYDPKSNRNEKDSAELFRAFVEDCMETAMDTTVFDAAETMILATEKHKVMTPSEASRTLSEKDELEEIRMQKHFLDMDMAVLGKENEAYLKYAALIRKEYEFVVHDVYCSKRAEILETFLGDKSEAGDKKCIYLTESFSGAFEARARENLRNEIRLLRSNTIPG